MSNLNDERINEQTKQTTDLFPEQKKYENELTEVLNKDNQKENIDKILNKLKESGYLYELDWEAIHSLDIATYSQEQIYSKLEREWVWAGKYVQWQKYNTPEAKHLKVVTVKFDKGKNQNLTEENFIQKMQSLWLREINFEEFLQFTLANSKYLKNGCESIYMPNKIISPENYPCRIAWHSQGIGMEMGTYQSILFDVTFPFVIEE